MGTKIKSFFDKIFGGGEPVVKHIEITPEDIRRDKLVSALKNQNTELQAIESKRAAEEGALRESEKDYDEEEVIKQNLKEQQFEIDRVSYGKGFSTRQFWAEYFGVPLLKRDNPGTKLSKILHYYDFQENQKLAPFYDILFGDNFIALTTKNNKIISRGKSLQDIFWEVGSLSNKIPMGSIPITKDKDGNFVENIMVWEAATTSRLEDGRVEYSPSRRELFYKLMQEKDRDISELHEHLAVQDESNVQQRKRIQELELSNKVLSVDNEISMNDKVKLIETSSQLNKIMNNMKRNMEMLTTSSVIQQDTINKLNNQVEILRIEAEGSGASTESKKAVDKIQQLLNLINTNRMVGLPETKVSPQPNPTKQNNEKE